MEPMLGWTKERVLEQLRCEVQELIDRFERKSQLTTIEIITAIRNTGFRGPKRKRS